jgi:hypothetical protein
MTPPARPTAEPWSILVYGVTSLDAQQRILMALRDIARPGVVALGTYCDDGPHVVVESPTRSGEASSRRIVFALDRDARCLSDVVQPTA